MTKIDRDLRLQIRTLEALNYALTIVAGEAITQFVLRSGGDERQALNAVKQAALNELNKIVTIDLDGSAALQMSSMQKLSVVNAEYYACVRLGLARENLKSDEVEKN
ncbi:hypothetical protein [Lichenihabitans psoromatis]|uniref:hypothetical protein n=1 Tax=Lichenihabitans psoromatis TaxID=2528642 RepID=UPI001038575A|nr:hypothetical protein [Lichenihabitans psoromatis]